MLKGLGSHVYKSPHNTVERARAVLATPAQDPDGLVAAAWMLEWLVADKYRKPDVPDIIKKAQTAYRAELQLFHSTEAKLAAARAIVAEMIAANDARNDEFRWPRLTDAWKAARALNDEPTEL